MPYIGRGLGPQGAFRILDDISGSFNGSTVTFALTVASAALTVGLPETLIIAVDGVIQEPGSAYTISGSNIVFGAAPQDAATFWGVEIGDVGTQTLSTDATEASKTNMKAEATGILYAPPDLLKHSPGVAKAWAKVAATGSFSGYDQYNMDFDSDHGAGMHTLGFTTEMENNGYVVVGNCTNTDGLYILTTYAAGGASFRVNIQNTGGTETDQQYGVAIFGQVT